MLKKKYKIILLVIAALLLFRAVLIGYRIYWSRPATNSKNILFEIKQGDSVRNVAENLQKEKLLKNTLLFRWYFSARALDKKLQIGSFELKPGYSIRALASILTDSNLVEAKFTFLEGWTLREYDHYLENQGVVQKKELEELIGLPGIDYRFNKNFNRPRDFSLRFDFLRDKPTYVSLEGYLFPDTYQINKSTNGTGIVSIMLENFGHKLTPALRQEISNQNKTIFEMVTVASLIEAEASRSEDRKMVSAILWRRLAVGMPLQLDSTVNYVTGKKVSSISLADQEIDSPYNTYKYKGLPLGPINNSSLDSLMAAIYPARNDYWYFLTGKDGKMYYAKNLKEHEKNKERYLK